MQPDWREPSELNLELMIFHRRQRAHRASQAFSSTPTSRWEADQSEPGHFYTGECVTFNSFQRTRQHPKFHQHTRVSVLWGGRCDWSKMMSFMQPGWWREALLCSSAAYNRCSAFSTSGIGKTRPSINMSLHTHSSCQSSLVLGLDELSNDIISYAANVFNILCLRLCIGRHDG